MKSGFSRQAREPRNNVEDYIVKHEAAPKSEAKKSSQVTALTNQAKTVAKKMQNSKASERALKLKTEDKTFGRKIQIDILTAPKHPLHQISMIQNTLQSQRKDKQLFPIF